MLALPAGGPSPSKDYYWKNIIILNAGTKLLHHHLYGDYDMDTVVGSVVQNPKNPALWGIRNEDEVNWTYENRTEPRFQLK